MNTYHIKLDLAKGYTNSLGNDYGCITLRQGDKQGCTITADLYDHGERFTQTGLTAFFVMELPDHAHYYRAPATYSDGTVTITINEQQAASATGTSNNAYFELLDGDTVIASTRSIRVLVLPDARGGKTAGETYDTEIEQALEEIATATDNANTATANANTATGNANAATTNANAATANANTATGNANAATTGANEAAARAESATEAAETATSTANAAATAANAAGDWANEAAARAESAVAHNIKIWFDYEDVGGRKLLTLCTTEGEE